jgi:hypothetical protein
MDMVEDSEMLAPMLNHNSHPTIPYRFKDYRSSGHAPADTQRDRGNCSRLYKVNIWMWCCSRGRPRMVSIAEAERAERLSESRIRVPETRKRRSEATAAAGAANGDGGSDSTLAYDIIDHSQYHI